MKTGLLIIISLALISLNVSNISAVCDPDIIKPGELCQDGFSTLIIEPHEARIENIDGQLFYVIGPFALEQEPNDMIRLEGVTFTHPSYPNPPTPGGPVSVMITFESGAKERIFKIGAPSPFIEFVGMEPQAGVRRNVDGSFDYLLSVKQQLVSPLKQFKLGVMINEIQCKGSLVLLIKYDSSPACVKHESAAKLISRTGWTDNHDAFVYPRIDPIEYREKFCELNNGEWSDEFNNCVGGRMEVSCDDMDRSKFTTPDTFLLMTEKGTCMAHELFCKSMGGNSTCMSYEQMGHGRDICYAVCEFED